MARKEFTITTFANHIGTTKQNIALKIKKNKFTFPGYIVDSSLKRTKIIKVDRAFLFHHPSPHVVIIIKDVSPELAVLSANDLLFDRQIVSFRFRLEDAREMEENETLISNI